MGRIFALSAAVAALVSSAAMGQEIQSSDALASAIVSSYEALDGSEFEVSGAIGAMFGDTLFFVDQTGRYEIVLDAGRTVRRQIEGCELQMFDADDSECQLTGMVEVSVDFDDDNKGDGLEVRYILFEVSEFSKAEK